MPVKHTALKVLEGYHLRVAFVMRATMLAEKCNSELVRGGHEAHTPSGLPVHQCTHTGLLFRGQPLTQQLRILFELHGILGGNCRGRIVHTRLAEDTRLGAPVGTSATTMVSPAMMQPWIREGNRN